MRLGVEYISDEGDYIQFWDETYTYCVEFDKTGLSFFQVWGFVRRGDVTRFAFHEVLDITTDERAYAALDGDCNFILAECQALAESLLTEYQDGSANPTCPNCGWRCEPGDCPQCDWEWDERHMFAVGAVLALGPSEIHDSEGDE